MQLQHEHVSRIRITVQGAVQGVGFRPFIYRLATDLHIGGWVSNTAQGVTIEAEGADNALQSMLSRIEQEKPPLALINSIRHIFIAPMGESAFSIQHQTEQTANTPKSALILPDVAICPDCLRELFDPTDRRYRYPFINCTHCGPRYSIIESLPYDRPNTAMRQFEMCEECRAEYENPLDRRFHAQPTACPHCGPHLELWDAEGAVLASDHDALLNAVTAICGGEIVALKGIGGFQLIVDACDDQAVSRLRQRKARADKPFAVMYPSLTLVKEHCFVSPTEERLLCSAEAPIVLLKRKESAHALATEIAPRNPYLGVMLPYTPLHHLLLSELGFPVVATSGNVSGEPLCIDEQEAVTRLHNVADVFLVHNRPILRPLDDSVAQVIMDRPMILRRARGYAPLPITVSGTLPPLIATGAHLKNTVALASDRQIWLSQHIGDLETLQTYEASVQALKDLQSLYEVQPQAVACDLHPDYLSTRSATMTGLPIVRVQHHYAHALACMAEHGIDAPALAIVWDGTGYGTDGTIWGGEFLRITPTSYERAAHLRPFSLIGGDRAAKEPRRSAFGLLYELFGDEVVAMEALAPVGSFTLSERTILRALLQDQLMTVRTTSAGRLFDAVASLLDLQHCVSFEGQAAMALEFAAADCQHEGSYPFDIDANGEIDWGEPVSALLEDLSRGYAVSKIAAHFHNTLAAIIITVAHRVGEETVLLSGGCFQNRRLLEQTIRLLQQHGFRPYWNERIPTNDGGIALGQIVAAAREYRGRRELSQCV
ncbi:MAG: carbamoyltransferase HypF [Anaerolineae bacterium]|nr:carbamoyltransferase HypF [Anaerolineae bacterium]